jgi:UDP-3-O-[3-hydroxymyristoyl] N-acetylglucosamine deacetylase/UDP-3-O-[3-hydroxymyristoyl] N-acetylglucosamine deacetylase/3-hydroxyacyl-[acyl-carrier-protein] dehydratase
MMQHRNQRTIARSAAVSGFGLFSGADVTLRFLPAPENHGIAFQRTDCRQSAPIPALVDYAVPRERRTALAHEGVTVEMVEHVMAALGGLQVDNCLVQLDAPEPPGCDGSSRPFVEALLDAGIVEQDAPRPFLAVESEVRVQSSEGEGEISARPLNQRVLAIGYQLDYGPRNPIPAQVLTIEITPESFANKLAFARTFVLESEVAALRARGYGRRTTARDLLIFGANGVVDNALYAEDECVRHKILDCVGDFALIGCDLFGFFNAYRSGHRLNREIIQRLKHSQVETGAGVTRKGAA